MKNASSRHNQKATIWWIAPRQAAQAYRQCPSKQAAAVTAVLSRMPPLSGAAPLSVLAGRAWIVAAKNCESAAAVIILPETSHGMPGRAGFPGTAVLTFEGPGTA